MRDQPTTRRPLWPSLRRLLLCAAMLALLAGWSVALELIDKDQQQRQLNNLSQAVGGFQAAVPPQRRLIHLQTQLPRVAQLLPGETAELERGVASLQQQLLNGEAVSGARLLDGELTVLRERLAERLQRSLAEERVLKIWMLVALAVLTPCLLAWGWGRGRNVAGDAAYGNLLFANAPGAVVLSDTEDRIVAVNGAYSRMTGYAEQEMVGRELTFNQSGQQGEEFFQSMRDGLASEGRWVGEFWLRNKDGEAFADKVTRLAIGERERPQGYLTLSMDVVGKDDAQRLMLWQAHHDTLTKLPNRNLFQERLSRVLLRAQEDAFCGSLISIDLDRFKIVNDSVGPAKGDQVLMEAAYRIAMCVRESDTVARLGGDHFVVLLSEIEEYQEVERIARKIVEDMERPFVLEQRELFVTASIGVAVIPTDGLETGELLQKADAARIQVKQDGGNNVAFFEPEMNARAERRMELETALRKAVSNDELVLFYQPVVDVKRGVVTSTEALLRWQHPQMGIISPGEFIPIAEDTGLIVEIGQWVVVECQRQLGSWRARGLTDLRISLNVSAVQLRQSRDVEKLLAVLGVGDATGITLELTESALIDNSEGAQQFLRGARALGSTVALDDFGTGFSSLGYLRNFEFDVLKIDKTFIDELSNTRDYGLVASIVSMGRILGMKVVAEGVEEAGQVERLKQIGCDYIQGFYYSRPLPAKEFEAFVTEDQLRNVG